VPALGGFAAVAYVSQSVIDLQIDSLWRALWSNGVQKGSFSTTSSTIPATFQGLVRIDKPAVFLVPRTPNTISVQITAYARLTTDLLSAQNTLLLQVASSVDVPISLTQENYAVAAVLDFTGFTVAADDITLVWSDLPVTVGLKVAEILNAMQGPEIRDWLAQYIRNVFAKLLQIQIPVNSLLNQLFSSLGGGGAVVNPPTLKLGGIQVLNGWLTLGVDDLGLPSVGDLNSIGLPDGADTSLSADTVFAYVDTGRVASYLQQSAYVGALFLIASKGVAVLLDGPPAMTVLSLPENGFHAHFTGEYSAPNPFPGGYATTIDLDIGISVSAGWVEFTTSPKIAVDLPLYAKIWVFLRQLFGTDLEDALYRLNTARPSTSPDSGTATFAVPGIPGVSVTAVLTGIKVAPDIVRTYGSILLGASASIAPPPSEDVSGAIEPNGIYIRERYLTVSYVNALLRVDPTYLVTFWAGQGSDGTGITGVTVWSGEGTDPQCDPIDIWQPSLYLETSYIATVTIEKPPGTQVGADKATIQIGDKFDRSHPYARWWQMHYWRTGTPPVQVIQRKMRRSAIHKTDVRERCLFCDVRAGKFYNIEPLDTLPPPDESKFRNSLCQYCFTPDEIRKWSTIPSRIPGITFEEGKRIN